jgi:hypothetical protein
MPAQTKTPTPMSAFEELQDSFVKVCRDPERPPIQWIYSVDDAWFHPASFNLASWNSTRSDEKKKLNEAVWQAQCCKALKSDYATKLLACTLAKPQQGRSAQTSSLSTAGPTTVGANLSRAEKIDDAAVANQLIQFATIDFDYGLCFCSFEYLWKHFEKSINAPQNAILFDLNHQLAGIIQQPVNLWGEWKTKIEAFGLFDSRALQDASLCGWLLHFAIKFGKLGKEKSLISPDHLLLVSSAIAGKGGPSADAMTQYLQVQLSMWNKLSTDQDFLKTGRMVKFSFAPLPKVVGSGDTNANLLDTGLKIFNNTFKDAANWPAMRDMLLMDLRHLWDCDPTKKMGHDAGADTGLRCDGWVDESNNDRKDTLRGTHFFHSQANPRQETIGAKSLLQFLRWALLRHDLCLPNNSEHWRLIFPTNPGVSYLIGIADLYERMCVLKENRTQPNVAIVVENDNCLKVQFTLANGGSVAELLTVAANAASVLQSKISRSLPTAKARLAGAHSPP